MQSTTRLATATATATAAAIALVLAADPTLAGHSGEPGAWPQWGGPGRDFSLVRPDAEPLPWAAPHPAPLWSRPGGGGYSALVHDGTRLYTMVRRGDDEVVLALSPDDGRTLWRHTDHTPAGPSDHLDTSYGNGPNATPLVADGRVYTLGFTGRALCLDAATGEVRWSHDLIAEPAALPYFGLAASPVRHGDLVVFVADGVYAFDAVSGEPRWRTREIAGSYASPLVRRRDDTAQLIVAGAGEIAGLDLTDGSVLWRHEHANDQRTILSTPILGDDDVLFVSAYFIGAVALKIAPDGRSMRELWSSPRMQVSRHSAVRWGDLVIGFHNSTLVALDATTGELAWRHRGTPSGNLLLAGDRLLVLDDRGSLHLLRLSPDGVEPAHTMAWLDGRSWSAPTLVGTRLFARNLETIAALELALGSDEAPVIRRPDFRARFDPSAIPEARRRAFGDATFALYRAAWHGEAAELLSARERFAVWVDDPHLGILADYYRGFASWQLALVTGGPEAVTHVDRAVEDLEHALGRDALFADAHALLGTVYSIYWSLAPRRAAVIGLLGDEHLQRAREIAPDDPRLALFEALDRFHSPPEYGGDRERGLADLHRAVLRFADEPPAGSGLLPDWGHATGWAWLAASLAETGQAEASRRAARKALAIAPDFAYARSLLDRPAASPDPAGTPEEVTAPAGTTGAPDSGG